MIRVAFYRAEGRLFDKLVRWWTRGKFSHCEILFSDGLCASASNRDGGIRFKEIDTSKWTVLEIDIPEEPVREWFTLRIGQKYDIFGLFGFVWRPISGRGSRWFCSEACMASMGIEDGCRYSPNEFYPIAKYLSELNKKT